MRTAPELRAGDADAESHGLLDVVGVDEQRGPGAHRVDLGSEGVLLGVVQQREGVRGRPHRRDAPAASGLEVRGGAEAGDVRCPGCGDGRPLARPTGAHLGERAAAGR